MRCESKANFLLWCEVNGRLRFGESNAPFTFQGYLICICLFVLLHLVIELSVLGTTASDYTFGIINLTKSHVTVVLVFYGTTNGWSTLTYILTGRLYLKLIAVPAPTSKGKCDR
jgi:hypothetical protein